MVHTKEFFSIVLFVVHSTHLYIIHKGKTTMKNHRVYHHTFKETKFRLYILYAHQFQMNYNTVNGKYDIIFYKFYPVEHFKES